MKIAPTVGLKMVGRIAHWTLRGTERCYFSWTGVDFKNSYVVMCFDKGWFTYGISIHGRGGRY